jgi:hypothetical protein
MIALTLLVVVAVYLGLCILAVRLTVRWAKRTGRSVKRWGIAAGLFMYLLVFWDHIPTLVLHKYYCATKAGFWVYKTPEQWKAENPGVAETLTWRNISKSYENTDGSFGLRLNERFIKETRKTESVALPVTIIAEALVDVKTNEIMAKRISVGSGYGALALGGDDWQVFKFWMSLDACLPNQLELSLLREEFKTIGKEIK